MHISYQQLFKYRKYKYTIANGLKKQKKHKSLLLNGWQPIVWQHKVQEMRD